MRSASSLGALLALSLVTAAGNLGAQTTVSRSLQVFNQLRPRSAYLGVGIADIDADRVARLKLPEERGVEVTNIEEGSPADTAGMKVGDVVLNYNGESILGAQQFVRLVRETPVGRKVKLGVWRNGKEQPMLITTAAFPARLPGQNSEDFVFANGGVLNGFTGPDMRTFVMPDVPTVIMAWNSSTLGLECEPVDSQLAQFFGAKQGVLVRSVGQGSAAEKAGLRAGDVLTSIGDRPIKSPEDLRRVMRGGAKQVAVALVREHRNLSVTISPAQERDE